MATKVIDTGIEYPSSDGKPVAESDIHRKLLLDVVERLIARYAHRRDVYASGNLLVYYLQDHPRKSLAPDAFVVFGVPNHDRETFLTWEEGAFPSVVFEFTSKTTRKEDLVTKFKIYQNIWKVQEYFLFDPRDEYLEPSLQGFRLVRGKLVPIMLVDGVAKSELLGITLSRDGEYLILKDLITGKDVLTDEEQKAVDAQQKAVDAQQKAVDAQQQAAGEKLAREQVEAENAILKAEIAALKRKKS